MSMNIYAAMTVVIRSQTIKISKILKKVELMNWGEKSVNKMTNIDGRIIFILGYSIIH